jgi:predicted ArsR family transcriptional regulator
MNTIDQEILTALATYQWKPSAAVYNFANHLNYSEHYTRRQLKKLAKSGAIEEIAEGLTYGKPRIIYRLKK